MVKKVLLITYFWPPSGKASVHLPLGIAKHLGEFGIEPIILTVGNESMTRKDNSLLSEIPQNLKVYTSDAIEPFDLYKKVLGKKKEEVISDSETISDSNKGIVFRLMRWIRMNLFVPDARLGWIPSAKKKGREIIKKESPDCIVTFGPPHSVHLIGRKLSKEFNIPYYPYLIDPWVDIAYYRSFKRSALTLYLDNMFERKVLHDSKKNIFVTETLAEDYIKKYPDIKDKSHIFYWGYEESKFAGVQKHERKKKVLLHAGNIFDYQNPKFLWKSLYEYSLKNSDFKIRFIGTVSPAIKNAITENGLDSITEYKGFLPYTEAVQEMMDATYLLVCATEKRHVPGKLFEYLRSGNKILAFGDDNNEVSTILERANGGRIYRYDEDPSEFFNDDKFESIIGEKEFLLYDRKILTEYFSKMLNNA